MTIGKKVFDDLYIHISAFKKFSEKHPDPLIQEVECALASTHQISFNVIKINFKKSI